MLLRLSACKVVQPGQRSVHAASTGEDNLTKTDRSKTSWDCSSKDVKLLTCKGAINREANCKMRIFEHENRSSSEWPNHHFSA